MYLRAFWGSANIDFLAVCSIGGFSIVSCEAKYPMISIVAITDTAETTVITAVHISALTTLSTRVRYSICGFLLSDIFGFTQMLRVGRIVRLRRVDDGFKFDGIVLY